MKLAKLAVDPMPMQPADFDRLPTGSSQIRN
jgi:hypothetical protein